MRKQKGLMIAMMLFLLTGCSISDQNETTIKEIATDVSETETTVAAVEESLLVGETDNGNSEIMDELFQFYGRQLPFDQSIFQTEQRIYALDELREMSDPLLAVFRNEMYARHGRIFNLEKWNYFFEQFSWYEKQYSADQFYEQQLLSELEKENLKRVLSVESERKSSILFTFETYPRVDGSTATIPLSEQLAADAMGIPIEEARLYTLHNKTHNAYVNLVEGRADIIFVTAPSEEELRIAEEAGVELEIHPIVKEGFVFLVNEQNVVKSLTQQEIVGIYAGKIKNWQSVGGIDQSILAYQRPVNSGSQSGMLALVMKGIPMMKAPSYYYPAEMDGLIEAVSSYDNAENAIGYSYYYYVSEMYFRKGIRLLAIDGVEPNPTTIQNGSYPYTTAYYAVFKKSESEDSSTRKLWNWIKREGAPSVEKAGYVPLLSTNQ